ncbi:YggS family pyridoxal phosphate-dependent enzyme [Brochothrix thermosphacta]|uniref:YggS family pyridoxal phosphate-dependent enzyme n=1 Tax=Brochothrix thermosphacta TaxID=2756 RepID=UPI0027124947|nr:YggS family pyridoxal phosphate-dependent enzyme [Brochothrix thermosphacta]MDO7863492.1 YggS family pyridoxal phosphate-dependent enzyme [Brochothrix thermosphacta]
MSIKSNFSAVTHKISVAAAAVGTNPQLVAVTKTVSSDVIEELYALGQRHFGENRADAISAKHDVLNERYPDIAWHFIGSLQTRKVKDILPFVSYIHSLDRLSLAKEISKRADRVIDCFIEVNVSGEDSKHGLVPEDVVSFIEKLQEYQNINIIGLMTMAPFTSNDDELKNVFSNLKTIQEDVMKQNFEWAPCTELSMGMSNDYPIAISAGATFVRVGTELVTEI